MKKYKLIIPAVGALLFCGPFDSCLMAKPPYIIVPAAPARPAARMPSNPSTTFEGSNRSGSTNFGKPYFGSGAKGMAPSTPAQPAPTEGASSGARSTSR